MSSPDDPRAPSPMTTAIGLARLEERVNAIIQRMDDREERQDERDAHFKLSLEAAVHAAVASAIREHVAPLSAKVDSLQNTQLQLRTVVKTSTRAAAIVGGLISFAWGIVAALLK